MDAATEQRSAARKYLQIGTAAAGVLAATVGAFKSADQVDAGHVGVLTTFGKITRIADPGLAFHWPWQRLEEMSLQSQTVDVPLEVYSKDSQLAPQNVLSVTFSLPKDSVTQVFSQYGRRYFEAVLKAPTENIFREAFGQRTADQIIANRESLNKDVSQRLEEEFKGRGVHFERLGISIKFNEAFNRSAEESAIARTKVNTAQQDLSRKEIEAQQAIIEAKGLADAAFAKKSKEAEGITIVGRAEADVLQMKGKAEAAVLELKSEAFAKNPEIARLLTAERWDGKLPTTMIPGQSPPMVTLDLKR